jgi:SAM-dependent methyltransferase
MAEPIGLFEEVLDADRGWMLRFVGKDQSSGLARLIDDLRRGPSATGDGKRIESGFSYWGTAPSVAWYKACNDPAYLVMWQSNKSFRERWHRLTPALPKNSTMHYVSLGIGTGEKDAHILADLAELNQKFYYFPVDMSGDLLELGVKTSVERLRGRRYVVYPIQLDFSTKHSLTELSELIRRCVGEEPILFSILGNTIANFTDDTDMLKNIVQMLRPQDRLLLEVAYSETANEDIANRAAGEYQRSEQFKVFVTSALLQNTDLPIELNRVDIIPAVEKEGRAISLKIVYNSIPEGEQITLPDRLKVTFPNNDTIRIYLTRKYTKDGISSLIRHAGCYSDKDFYAPFGADQHFGMALHLLVPRRSSVFVSYSHKDREFVEQLQKGLLAHGIRPWIDFNDTDPEVKLSEQINQAILDADKLLLVFSEESEQREWVRNEVKLAFRKRASGGEPKLRVVLLAPADKLRMWDCIDVESGEHLGPKLLTFPLVEFTGWRDWSADDFNTRVAQLARGLK